MSINIILLSCLITNAFFNEFDIFWILPFFIFYVIIIVSSVFQSKATAISEVSQLRTRIETALDQRGRHYVFHFTFPIRFEKDDTSAEKDTANIQMILKMLGLPMAMEMVIPSDDVTSGWSVSACLIKLIRKSKLKTDRALIIGHYSGHEDIDSLDQLEFHASFQYHSRMIYLDTIGRFFQQSNILSDTDTCIILDACYNAIATRAAEGRNWTAELVAAVRPVQKALGNWFYLARIQNKTFHFACSRRGGPKDGQGSDWYQFGWHCFDFTRAIQFGYNVHISTQCRTVRDFQFKEYSVSPPPEDVKSASTATSRVFHASVFIFFI